jgi:hypothetical protein
MAVERIAGLVEIDIVRQLDRQVFIRHRNTPQSSQWMTGIGQPQ